jgi:hypothetical protein
MRQYLLTLENVLSADLTKIAERLAAIGQRVLLRIPIQENHGEMDKPSAYEDSFIELKKHADLMIEFVDSDAAAYLSATEYASHVRKCLEILGPHCKVAEAGNEINGENWRKTDDGRTHPHAPEEIVSMVSDAVTASKHYGLKTAITYYLSTDETPPMLAWMRQYGNTLSSDYGLISYYPNSAEIALTPDEIFEAFSEFSRTVQAAQIGWGEYGLTGDYRNVRHAQDIVRQVEKEFWPRFSGIPNYQGFGGFWEWEEHAEVDSVLSDAWR